MDLPQEMGDYIKESIDCALGLSVSEKTLHLKLRASEEARKRIQDQYFYLHDRLKEKDEVIERAKAEASMNAQALKKFVEENQKLAIECANLLSQCSRWEKECSLYDRDREALMEFGNEADERAKEAEIRVLEVEDELRRVAEELQFYKHEYETLVCNEARASEELQLLRERIRDLERVSQCSSSNTEDQKSQPHILISKPAHNTGFGSTLECQLLESVVASLVDKDAVAANARAFLEANNGVESCQKLLKMWEWLNPSTQNIISLAAEVKTLQKDKEHLKVNLHRAEEEVKVFCEENCILDEENKRLMRLLNRERNHQGSGGKHTCSASAKGNKRKSSPKICAVEKMNDLNGPDSPRQPLSPLYHNSPDSRMHKK
ncbi:PREDICTED: uncharacterized protein LOC104606987 isoform X2 [Nelumbo nucifera]|uniref:Uncharacterized protein LOC104606987 isoform X2 n=1 Tax=Nelumbo nucifera TaxID=4432 RepID=A0A1U8AS48_NELNU|nr:PREDICTED: uncharacterized protein LOC104606987 isoform X2 [Nelumbo nucifera]